MPDPIPTYKMPPGSPPAEVQIDEPLIRLLLESQHSDLADLPLTLLENGFDNTMYRLGEAYLVRLPRRKAALDCLINEQTWLPKLAPRLPLPISAPLRLGQPQHGYPWVWSILPWLDGNPADLAPPGPGEGATLAGFLRALHQPAPADAPINNVRGIPIAVRAENNEERIARLTDTSNVITPEIRQAWTEARGATVDTSPT